MDFLSYLKTSAKDINQELDQFLESWQKEVGEISPRLNPLVQVFIEACEGGKRLRGALVKLGYEISANRLQTTDYRGRRKMEDERHEILKPAAAFEIFQTAILAHDDIIDQSDLRRGRKTLWKALGGNHYGISQTICLGDIGFFLAYKLLAESNFPDKLKNKAIQFFTKSMISTGLGQMMDVALPNSSGWSSEEDVLTIFRLKTAHYTLVGPLQLGAILGGGNDNLLSYIEKFGESLGIAFQIQDDILGVFGDEKTLGKSVASDAEEGKITLLLIEALRRANARQKQILDKYYDQGKIGEEELNQIRKIFIETGAMAYSQEKAQQLVAQAKDVIRQMDISQDHKSLLEEMADFLVKRDK